MKVTFFLFAMFSPLMAANDLRLVVRPDQPGRINDHEIQAAQIAPGGSIQLQVILSDWDFTLAGAEFVLRYPSYAHIGGIARMSTNDGDFQCAAAPVAAHSDWGTDLLLVLPVDEDGVRTADHVTNEFGLTRVGIVVRHPEERPVGTGSGEMILAEFEFFLGNASQATCISSSAVFELIQCDTGSSLCEYFAREDGTRVNVNASPADRTVTLHNSQAGYLKGDINGSGSVTTQDVSPFIQCNKYGQNSSGCPLSGLSPDDYLQVADMDCDGVVHDDDLSALINAAMGLTGNFKRGGGVAARLTGEKDAYRIDFGEVPATVAVFSAWFDRSPSATIGLSGSPGWEIVQWSDPLSNQLNVALVSKSGEPANLPSFHIQPENPRESLLNWQAFAE